MGTIMKDNGQSFASVSFRKRGWFYQGLVSLDGLASLHDDPAETMHALTISYAQSLEEIRKWRRRANALRKKRQALPAVKAWVLGNIVHELNANMASHGCKIDDPYGHLERHARLHRKWLQPFVTFRRYVPNMEDIPGNLKWHEVMKAPKLAGESISSGHRERTTS